MASVKKQEVFNALAVLGWGTLGALASSWFVNFVPVVKTANPVVRSLGQAGVGLGVLVFTPGKFVMVRSLGLGAAMAGALGATERITKMKTLAGEPATTLNAEEIAALQMAGYLPMNGPVLLRNPQAMAGPVDLRSMSASRPSMMGGFKPGC
jgi:hypothetical protein